jgi:hypothetical protein
VCANDILEASKIFLNEAARGHVGRFPAMDILIPTGMTLGVSPIWLRHLNAPRLMVLHFWRTPLSQWQLSAAGAVLRSALHQNQPDFAECELDFISVSLAGASKQRRFEHFDWGKLKPLSEKELHRFWRQFCAAWSNYKSRGPRKIRRKSHPGMFD